MAGPSYPIPLGSHPSSFAIDEDTLARTKSPLPDSIGLARSARLPPSLAIKVLHYAKARLGTRVGDGQCAALADEALRSAGARSAKDFGPITPDCNYISGTRVFSLSDARPGDIGQFRDYRYTRTEENDDGSCKELTLWPGEPKHTAIVVSKDGNGLLTVIEQNVPERKGSPVRETQLGFVSNTTTSGGTTTRQTVSGQWWFYRPQPR
jgi:hypothetical protein